MVVLRSYASGTCSPQCCGGEVCSLSAAQPCGFSPFLGGMQESLASSIDRAAVAGARVPGKTRPPGLCICLTGVALCVSLEVPVG